jgi:hypothetical protein
VSVVIVMHIIVMHIGFIVIGFVDICCVYMHTSQTWCSTGCTIFFTVGTLPV